MQTPEEEVIRGSDLPTNVPPRIQELIATSQTPEDWRERLKDILVDVCENEECKELADHGVLKNVVRERLEELIQSLLDENTKKAAEIARDHNLMSWANEYDVLAEIEEIALKIEALNK